MQAVYDTPPQQSGKKPILRTTLRDQVADRVTHRGIAHLSTLQGTHYPV